MVKQKNSKSKFPINYIMANLVIFINILKWLQLTVSYD